MTTNPEAAKPHDNSPARYYSPTRGSALAVTTGITAGVLLLGTAAAGFHDPARLRPPRPAQLRAKAR